jgi:shikimate kinase
MSDPTLHLVLVGLMGAGKTSVGKVCARRLDRRFVDTDDVVVAAAAMSVPEIFEAEGEAGFRARERQAVVDVCESPEPLVIACGGGAATDAENRRALRRRGFVVWLQAPPAELGRRVGSGAGRPLLAEGGTLATLERLAGLRADAYAAVADATVETEGRSVDQVADAVLEAYG